MKKDIDFRKLNKEEIEKLLKDDTDLSNEDRLMLMNLLDNNSKNKKYLENYYKNKNGKI